MSTPIPFYKMQGSGNDFVLLDNTRLKIDRREMSAWAKKLCVRAFGIGADGLIFLESPPPESSADYCWHFFNSDGSRAEMCGNGSRCAARLAYDLGLAPAAHTLQTDVGPVRAEVDPAGTEVKVQLTRPRDLNLNIPLELDSQRTITVHFVNTGVPHAVHFSPHAKDADLKALGPAIRYHSSFAPDGTNVNVVEVKPDGSLFLRTYERGVEDETFACGTGAAAAAVIAHNLGHCGTETPVVTTGGERLQINLEDGQVFLKGKAVLVFSGELNPLAVGL